MSIIVITLQVEQGWGEYMINFKKHIELHCIVQKI